MMMAMSNDRQTINNSVMPSTPSYLLTRSLIPSPHLPRPTRSHYEHINISSVDTPTLSLRNEILIGFLSNPPYSLVTLARPLKNETRACDLGLWHFHPRTPVELYRRLSVCENPDYLPITVASTATVKEKVYQGIYRSASDDGEGCIEIRGMDLSSEE